MKTLKEMLNESLMMESTNSILKPFIKHAVKADEFVTGGLSVVISKDCENDIESFLGKPSTEWLVFTEGHMSDENTKGYRALNSASMNAKRVNIKEYNYVNKNGKATNHSFNVYYYDLNGFKFVQRGGDGDDYCFIA